MESDLVSVIIPVYNGAKFIERAIRSVFAQTYKKYEIIVVDDKSDDNTLEVLNQFNDRAIIVKHDKNRGVSAARNTGLKICKGEIIAFLDQDDIWHEKKLEIAVQVLRENNEILYLFSDFNRFEWETGKFHALSNSQIHTIIYTTLRNKFYTGFKEFIISKEDMFHLLLSGYPVYPSTMVVRRSIFDRIGQWYTPLKPWTEDFEFSLRASKVSNFLYIDECLTNIGRHTTNVSIDARQQAEGSLKVLEHHMKGDFFSSQEKSQLKYYLGKRNCGLGHRYLHSGRVREARKKYIAALKISVWFPHALLRIIFSYYLSAKNIIANFIKAKKNIIHAKNN